MDLRFPGHRMVFHHLLLVHPCFHFVEVLCAAVGHSPVDPADDLHLHIPVIRQDPDSGCYDVFIRQGYETLKEKLCLHTVPALPADMAGDDPKKAEAIIGKILLLLPS